MVIGSLLALAGSYYFWPARTALKRLSSYREPAPVGFREERLKRLMQQGESADRRFAELAQYFADGFIRHNDAAGSRVYYAGYGSWSGSASDGVEGFARTGVLIAAYINSGRIMAAQADVLKRLRSGLVNGTDPTASSYWGEIQQRSQLIVEAADIARIVWLTKSQIWDGLTQAQHQHIVRWLSAAAAADVPQNNWMLMRVTIACVLIRLKAVQTSDELAIQARQMFANFRSFYLSNGWFFDRPEGVDFYNTWGIAWELFWIHELNPELDADFIVDAIGQSASLTEHLISPNGIPIMGRSICYRTAVPVPIIAASLLSSGPGSVAAGRARRALDVVWQYFIRHDSLQDGALTQGYFKADPRVLDRYSGTGSCQWGLRSLTLAFLHRPGDAFWAGPEEPLPVEIGDYRLEMPALGWIVTGNQATGEIAITLPANHHRQQKLDPYTLQIRIRELWTGRPLRPLNHSAKYEAEDYSSAMPFPMQP